MGLRSWIRSLAVTTFRDFAESHSATLRYQAMSSQERLLMLGGHAVALQNRNRSLNALSDAEFRVFSQWGEDGILDWLIQQLPDGDERFVEFGVENYLESNTRFLLQHRNWKGLIMDGSTEYMDSVRRDSIYWRHDLTAVGTMVTAENINSLLRDHGFSGEIGLLSIDIDGNDYWVWDAVTVANPRLVSCEYNPIFGDLLPVTIPYRADYSRFDGHYSGLCFGAGIKALTYLAEKKGYTFLGACSNGINAFFVRNDLARYYEDKLQIHKSYPSRHRDSRDKNGSLNFTGGVSRTTLIKDCRVVRVDTGEQGTLDSFGEPLSAEWKAML